MKRGTCTDATALGSFPNEANGLVALVDSPIERAVQRLAHSSVPKCPAETPNLRFTSVVVYLLKKPQSLFLSENVSSLQVLP
jgi:hypothetical protein